MDLNEIIKQIKERYHIKNCYGCLYSDYSVYGNGSFGDMACFLVQKEKYIQTRGKLEYIGLEPDFDVVQEIYCCDAFKMRQEGVGYRG